MSATQPFLDRPYRRHSFLGPVLLIGVGVLLLLNTLGQVRWATWGVLLELWPVALIAVGLDLMVGRRSRLGSLTIALLALVVFGIAVWRAPPPWRDGVPVAGQTIAQTLDGAVRAEVELDVGAGTLELGALDGGQNLLQGTLESGPAGQARRSFHVKGDTAFFKLSSEQDNLFAFLDERHPGLSWDLRLSQQVPLALRVNTGVGTARLDLTQLRVTELTVDSGVGETIVTLPRHGSLQGTVNGGVGQTTIIIPTGVASRIETEQGLGAVEVEGRFETRADGVYVSSDYATAEERVDLVVNGGLGAITIREQAGR